MLGWARLNRSAAGASLQALYQEPVSVPALNALGLSICGELTAAVVVHTWAAILEPGNEITLQLSLAFHRLQVYGLASPLPKKAAGTNLTQW